MDQDKINQIIAYAIAIVTGIVAYFRGARSAAPASEGAPSLSSADTTRAELKSLLEERRRERDRKFELDIEAVRADFVITIKALKESIDTRFHEADGELNQITEAQRELAALVHKLEMQVVVLLDRQERHDPHRGHR